MDTIVSFGGGRMKSPFPGISDKEWRDAMTRLELRHGREKTRRLRLRDKK